MFPAYVIRTFMFQSLCKRQQVRLKTRLLKEDTHGGGSSIMDERNTTVTTDSNAKQHQSARMVSQLTPVLNSHVSGWLKCEIDYNKMTPPAPESIELTCTVLRRRGWHITWKLTSHDRLEFTFIKAKEWNKLGWFRRLFHGSPRVRSFSDYYWSQ